MDFDKEIKISEFVSSMKFELNRNQHKGDWLQYAQTGSFDEMKSELQYHVDKLNYAIEINDTNLINEYSADVANCAMFINIKNKNKK